MNERRDDWAHGVDENLASLNVGFRVWERELGTIQKMLGDIDKILRGDPEKETSGFLGRLETMETNLSKINAVLFVDSTGKKGLIHDVSDLQEGREDRRINWVNVTKIIVSLIMSGILGALWPHVKQFLFHQKMDHVDQVIENGTHPKNRYHHYTLKE